MLKNVKIYDSTITKIIEEVWHVWNGCQLKAVLSKKNMAAQFRFVRLLLTKILSILTDESQADMFGYNAQQPLCENQTSADDLGATGRGHLAVTESTLTSSVYQSIPQLKIGWNGVM